MEEECKHRVPPRRRRRARHWWRTQLQTRASTDAYTVNRPAMNMKWANLNSLLFTFLILIAGKIRLFWSNYSRHLRLIKKIPWFLHLVNATTIFQKMGNISCAIMKNKLNIFVILTSLKIQSEIKDRLEFGAFPATDCPRQRKDRRTVTTQLHDGDLRCMAILWRDLL